LIEEEDIMSLIRWQPARELENFRQQMNRLMDEWMMPELELPSLTMGGFEKMPAVELSETETEVILKAQLPGIDIKDLEVEVGEDTISISGEQKQEERKEEKGYFRSEFHYGHFVRTIPLPVAIKPDAIASEFKDGLLTLTLPKAEVTKRKVVKVNLTA
jgi:HSP20 family protein